ncbi:hypothetical protein P7K49_010108 [Saguinus oedipus]|uniref:Uncharacterized protein n=1 Tax=Saguinus oedipus TaxID=9490 RepID=A0ABQ9VQ56_SAGOE|nr:hypothetical protein P7K49_010108 [Saguinus oedipus]
MSQKGPAPQSLRLGQLLPQQQSPARRTCTKREMEPTLPCGAANTFARTAPRRWTAQVPSALGPTWVFHATLCHRKIMDSGELDFYQHDKVCSNTCRSTKIDLSGARVSLSSPTSAEYIPLTPAAADGRCPGLLVLTQPRSGTATEGDMPLLAPGPLVSCVGPQSIWDQSPLPSREICGSIVSTGST